MRIKKISRYINVKFLCNVITPVGFVAVTMAFEIPLFISLTIIGGIAVHELGHYTAMKYFTYNKLALYLVMPIGGLVYGDKKNQKTSEYLIILLAGPAPGMVLGGIMMYAGINMDWYELEISGAMLLGINAFNLLPLFPLDGGRFVACLCRLGNRYLLFPLIITFLLNIFIIFFSGWYFLAIIAAIQLFFLVLALMGHEITDEFEYDLTVLRIIAFTIIYVILIGVPAWLMIFGY